jgi:hypothetical protein
MLFIEMAKRAKNKANENLNDDVRLRWVGKKLRQNVSISKISLPVTTDH